MITAVRLRDRNPKLKHMMRTYASVSGKVYKAGDGYLPPAWRVLSDEKEIRELSEILQFEIRRFDSIEELQLYIQEEMEAGARLGKPAVRAQIEGTRQAQVGAPKRDLSVLQPQTEDEGSKDGSKSNAETSSSAPEPETDYYEDKDPVQGNEGSKGNSEASTMAVMESQDIIDAREALQDAIDRELSTSYVTRMQNKLNKLLEAE